MHEIKIESSKMGWLYKLECHILPEMPPKKLIFKTIYKKNTSNDHKNMSAFNVLDVLDVFLVEKICTIIILGMHVCTIWYNNSENMLNLFSNNVELVEIILVD